MARMEYVLGLYAEPNSITSMPSIPSLTEYQTSEGRSGRRRPIEKFVTQCAHALNFLFRYKMALKDFGQLCSDCKKAYQTPICGKPSPVGGI